VNRRPGFTLFGLLLLLTLAVGAAVLAQTVVAVYRDPGVDFTASWRLRSSEDLTFEISEDGGVYLVSFAPRDAGWRRRAEARRVDRFQLAGRLGEIEGASPPGEPPAILQAATGASVSFVGVNDDTVSASVRDDGAASWTDLGSFERTHLWSDPYRAAGQTLLYVLGMMAIALTLWIPIAGGRHAQRDPQPRRLVLRVLTVLGAVGLLVAILVGAPTLAWAAVAVPFAPWLIYLIKWLPDEITGTGQLLDYIFSPKLREPFRRDQAARDAQAIRGAALEKCRKGAQDDRSTPTRLT
jgi:hypothetical protein